MLLTQLQRQGGLGYPNRMQNHDAAVEPTSHRFTSQGVTLHYADWGNETAPLLLLLHGTRDHARSWDWTAWALKDRWHVVALDLRGHGDSDWSADGAYIFPYQILDLVEMIERLGQEQVTIVGHSYGGNVAARYAGLFPSRVRKIVFVDSLGPTPDNEAEWAKIGPVARSRDWVEQRRDPRQMTARRFATIEEATTRMAKANPHLSVGQVVHLTKHGVRLHEDGYAWKFDPRVSMFMPEDFAVEALHYWREITAPVLIMHGERSFFTSPAVDGRVAFFRDQRTMNFERSGHWIHHDQLDDFLAALDAFL